MRPLALVLAVAMIVLVGCGKSSTSSSGGSAAVTTSQSGSALTNSAKFALHAGLAFGAFHRYIYKPLKSGELKSPFSHKLVLLKAAAAAAFTLHEIRLAKEAARGSPRLARLIAPLSVLGAAVGAAVASAKSGHVDSASLQGGSSTITSIKRDASSAGTSIAETTPSLP